MSADAPRHPLDVRPCWFNPIRRLQSVARNQSGMAIVSMKFLVNENGDPVLWTDPKVTLLEPGRNKDAIMQVLTE